MNSRRSLSWLVFLFAIFLVALPACNMPLSIGEKTRTPTAILPATLTAQALPMVGTLQAAQTKIASPTAAVVQKDTPLPVELLQPTVLPSAVPTEGIPSPQESVLQVIPSSYQLKKGEFPFCIARRYNLNPYEIMRLNRLRFGQVYYPGQVILLPQTGNPFPWNRTLRAHPDTYVVRRGDTIYGVACYYGNVDPMAIAAANGLNQPYKLRPGTLLQIPASVAIVNALPIAPTATLRVQATLSPTSQPVLPTLTASPTPLPTATVTLQPTATKAFSPTPTLTAAPVNQPSLTPPDRPINQPSQTPTPTFTSSPTETPNVVYQPSPEERKQRVLGSVPHQVFDPYTALKPQSASQYIRDAITETGMGGGGGEDRCAGKPELMIYHNQENYGRSELFTEVQITSCGWKKKESVSVEIVFPDGSIAANLPTERYQTGAELRYATYITDPPGDYQVNFRGSSGRERSLKITLNLPPKPLARIETDYQSRKSYILYNFTPGETITVRAYRYQKKQIFSYQEYQVDSTGQLIVDFSVISTDFDYEIWRSGELIALTMIDGGLYPQRNITE